MVRRRKTESSPDFIRKVKWTNGLLDLQDGYTLEKYEADRERAIARWDERNRERGTQAQVVIQGRCKDPQRLLGMVGAFIEHRLPQYSGDGPEPLLHTGGVAQIYGEKWQPELYEIGARMRGWGLRVLGELKISPAGDTEWEFELVRWSMTHLDRLSDYGEIQSVFDEFSSTLQEAYGSKTGHGRGRPRNVDDDWAWNQVHVKKRDRKEVYPEWLERIGKRRDQLADLRDSFNKAIRPH